MTEARKPSPILMVAVVALLSTGYVGAYYAMVEPVPLYGNLPPHRLHRPVVAIMPVYVARGNRIQDWVFTPAHWLDRRIRPHVWEPGP